MRCSSSWIRLGVLVFVLLGLVLGCGKEVPVHPVPEFRVQLVFSEDDNTIWGRHGDLVNNRLQDDYRATVSSVLAVSPTDRRTTLKASGSQSVDLVVCIGPEFERSVLSEGPKFPQTAFVLDRGEILAPNVARVEFLHKGAAYLAGVTAGIIGGSRVGIVTGNQEIGNRDIEAGFEQGFRRRHPWGRVELALGSTGIELLADKGIKVALYAAAEPEPEVLAAAERFGVSLISNSEITMREHPDVVVAAIVVDVADALKRIAADVIDDTFVGRVYAFDLGSGVVDLMLQPALAENQKLTEALDQARAAVNAGMVEIESLGL